jgi:hypothetical protein
MSTILQGDRVQINNRWAHCDGTNAGFLNTGGGWDMYVNNSGQIWTPNYGWLHDRFAHRTPVAGQGPQGDHGVRNNCGNINCNTVINCGYEIYDTGNGQQRLRYYIEGYNVSWNCNCACACACGNF